MKRLFSAGSAAFLLGLLLLLAGCASYDRQAAPGRSLNGVRRFFVLSNQNDNHALDHQIAAALKLRGLEVETGPMTMRPDDAQVVITYEDRWEWDFGDRLAYLQFVARDVRSGQPVATVRYFAKIPKSKGLPAVIGELIDRLLGDARP